MQPTNYKMTEAERLRYVFETFDHEIPFLGRLVMFSQLTPGEQEGLLNFIQSTEPNKKLIDFVSPQPVHNG